MQETGIAAVQKDVKRPFLSLEAVGVRRGHQGKEIGQKLLAAFRWWAKSAAEKVPGTFSVVGQERC